MKKLTIYGLAISLLIATTGAFADSRGHGPKHGKHHYKPKGHYYGYYRPYHRPWNYPRYYRPGYYYYYPSYLGAALLGSALTYSLFHTHNGAYCYDNHGNDRYQQSSRSSEVVGCHRIERLPDGTERRVEVPLSQCY